ncbi:helix-turn-helix domain-containing protein [Leifsonia sp. NPDC058248]|uniref:helix-turn-helix domain-containing protein n=1 Tax=Leifsonia sp. NPDC058248 TaxID=3346402 RepID=UPI0036DF95E7
MPDDRTTSTPIDRALADVLVAAYKGKRMNQATLVEATGIKSATMQRLMAGKTRFDVDQLFAIAEAIGGRSAADYMREAEATVARHVSADAANVTHINTKKGDEWQGEDHALNEWDAAAKKSDTVIEISPDDVTP